MSEEKSVLNLTRELVNAVVNRPPNLDADTAMMRWVRANLTGQPTDMALRVMATAFVSHVALADRANIISMTIIKRLIRDHLKCTDADLDAAAHDYLTRTADELFPDAESQARRFNVIHACQTKS